jgi:hypothetical protein
MNKLVKLLLVCFAALALAAVVAEASVTDLDLTADDEKVKQTA